MSVQELSREERTRATSRGGGGPPAATQQAAVAQDYYAAADNSIKNALSMNSQEFNEEATQEGGQ